MGDDTTVDNTGDEGLISDSTVSDEDSDDSIEPMDDIVAEVEPEEIIAGADDDAVLDPVLGDDLAEDLTGSDSEDHDDHGIVIEDLDSDEDEEV